MSMPAEQMQQEMGQDPAAQPQQAPPRQQMTEDDELDVDIAAGIGAQMMSNEKAMAILSKAFAAPSPTKMLAVFLAQLIEKIQTKSMDTDVVLNPIIWLAQGGVIDELADELSDIAERSGAEYTPELAEQVKAELVNVLKARSQQEKERAGQGQPQPQQLPPSKRGLAGYA